MEELLPTLLPWLASLIPGGIGGLIAGAPVGSRGFGVIGNFLAGAIGGGIGGQLIGLTGMDLSALTEILSKVPELAGINLGEQSPDVAGGMGGGAIAAILATILRSRD